MEKVIVLETDLATKDRELMAARSSTHKSNAVDTTLPSFELLSQEINNASNNAANMDPHCTVHNTESSQSVEELKDEIRTIKAKLAECEKQIVRIQQEKLKEITELERKNIVLQKELNGEKRANEGMRGVCTILRRKTDEAQQKYEELSKKENEYKEEVSYANQMYEEQMFKMKVVQARLETMQPPLLKKNVVVSPPTMIKNIRARHEEKGRGKRQRF